MKTINDLYTYQRAGVDFLLEKPEELSGKPHRLLAWDMGTGKTPTALAALLQISHNNVLIVCPATIKETWKRQMMNWFWRLAYLKPDPFIVQSGIDFIPNSGYIIVNYELLLNPAIYKQLMKRDYDVIILDEAHRLKTLNSKRSNLILGRKGSNLISKANYKWLLSGSIMPNRPIELFPILKTLAPETIRPYDTWEKFGRYFCNGFKERFGDYNFKGASHIDELKERLQPFMSVVKLEEVCDELPDVLDNTVYFDIGNISCDSSDTALPTLRRLVGEAKVPKIIEYLKDWLENNEGKLVVFTYHREVLARLYREIALITGRAVAISGDNSVKEKQDALYVFEKYGDARVLLAQITTAGEGIDGLQHVCNNIVFAELDWSAGGHDQAIGRLHRIGQTKPVYVTKLVAENTLDEHIVATVEKKQKVREQLFNQEKKMTEKFTFEKQLERIAEGIELLCRLANKNGDAKKLPVIEPPGQEPEVELEELPTIKAASVKPAGRISKKVQAALTSPKAKVNLDDIKDLCRQYIVSAPTEDEQATLRADIKEIVERQGVASLNDLGEDHYGEVHELIKELVDSLPADLGV